MGLKKIHNTISYSSFVFCLNLLAFFTVRLVNVCMWVVFIILLSSGSMVAQLPEQISIQNKSIPHLKQEQSLILPLNYIPKRILVPNVHKPKTMNWVFKPLPLNGVSQIPLAFFCRIEVFLEKKNGVPIKFRLGDIDKVDQSEGKRK